MIWAWKHATLSLGDGCAYCTSTPLLFSLLYLFKGVNMCVNYDNPECFEVFHECSEQKQWELYRNMKELLEQMRETNYNNVMCYTQQVNDLKDRIDKLDPLIR